MHLTPAEYADLIKRRPHLAPALGAVPAKAAEPTPAQTLDRGSGERQGGKASVRQGDQGRDRVRPNKMRPGGSQSVIVTLIRHGRRLLDAHDNLPASLKPLVDAIAAKLQVDDKDPRIRWQYGQVESRGHKGVSVMIETNTTP